MGFQQGLKRVTDVLDVLVGTVGAATPGVTVFYRHVERIDNQLPGEPVVHGQPNDFPMV
jgi:hypothetical protein